MARTAANPGGHDAAGTISVEVAARLLMVTPEWIQRLSKEGWIAKTNRGQYRVVDVVQGYIRFLKDQARRSSKTAAHTRHCSAKWIGPGRGWVDPHKEATAATERLAAGLSTLERECAEQGEDYLETIQQRARERKEMIALGLDPDAIVARKSAPVDDGEDQPSAKREKAAA